MLSPLRGCYVLKNLFTFLFLYYLSNWNYLLGHYNTQDLRLNNLPFFYYIIKSISYYNTKEIDFVWRFELSGKQFTFYNLFHITGHYAQVTKNPDWFFSSQIVFLNVINDKKIRGQSTQKRPLKRQNYVPIMERLKL